MFLFIVQTDLLYTIKKDKKYTEFSAVDCDLPQTIYIYIYIYNEFYG